VAPFVAVGPTLSAEQAFQQAHAVEVFAGVGGAHSFRRGRCAAAATSRPSRRSTSRRPTSRRRRGGIAPNPRRRRGRRPRSSARQAPSLRPLAPRAESSCTRRTRRRASPASSRASPSREIRCGRYRRRRVDKQIAEMRVAVHQRARTRVPQLHDFRTAREVLIRMR
jgi:hypothetical protein